jgi:hypothetical protein
MEICDQLQREMFGYVGWNRLRDFEPCAACESQADPHGSELDKSRGRYALVGLQAGPLIRNCISKYPLRWADSSRLRCLPRSFSEFLFFFARVVCPARRPIEKAPRLITEGLRHFRID